MIKVKILMSIAGNAEPMYGMEDFSFHVGQEVEVNQGLAMRWVESGVAEALEEFPPEQDAETASIEAPEKAVKPSGVKKRPG